MSIPVSIDDAQRARPEEPLRDRQLRWVSFAHTDLEGADLRGVRLTQVDLTGASLRGARLEGASFELVDASAACFANASGAFHADRSTFRSADFSGASLERTAWHGCSLERAVFTGADLSRAILAHCNAAQASFRECTLMWVNSVNTSYAGAELAQAHNFFVTREIVVEVLHRALGGDSHMLHILGSAMLDERWCYPEWKQYLENSPLLRNLAMDTFLAYPRSGCAQALQRGWRPPRAGGPPSPRAL